MRNEIWSESVAENESCVVYEIIIAAAQDGVTYCPSFKDSRYIEKVNDHLAHFISKTDAHIMLGRVGIARIKSVVWDRSGDVCVSVT